MQQLSLAKIINTLNFELNDKAMPWANSIPSRFDITKFETIAKNFTSAIEVSNLTKEEKHILESLDIVSDVAEWIEIARTTYNVDDMYKNAKATYERLSPCDEDDEKGQDEYSDAESEYNNLSNEKDEQQEILEDHLRELSYRIIDAREQLEELYGLDEDGKINEPSRPSQEVSELTSSATTEIEGERFGLQPDGQNYAMVKPTGFTVEQANEEIETIITIMHADNRIETRVNKIKVSQLELIAAGTTTVEKSKWTSITDMKGKQLVLFHSPMMFD